MTEIVNLRTARKRRQREDAEARASQNRVRHGLPKAARTLAGIESKRTTTALDGHRLADADTPGASDDR